jgi:hypothetical protein
MTDLKRTHAESNTMGIKIKMIVVRIARDLLE